MFQRKYSVNTFETHLGPTSLQAVYVSSKTFKSIPSLTGRECRDGKHNTDDFVSFKPCNKSDCSILIQQGVSIDSQVNFFIKKK